MGDLLFLLTSSAIIQILLFFMIIAITIAPLFIWNYVKKASQIQLDTLIAIENQNKILIELLKATTKNENYSIELEKRIRTYSK
jgi:hypothetical protein